MAKRETVQYVVNERGRKVAVQMSFRAYRQLMEDLDDLRVKAERSRETPEDFSKVLKELRNAAA